MNVMKLLRLDGRIALVTGGAGKYGSCIAQGLAEAGATVIIASRDIKKCKDKAERLRKQGLDINAEELDITKEKSIKVLRDKIILDYKKIDVLVNNAVGRSSVPSFAEHWEESMKVNAVGLRLITQIFIEQMIKQNCGNIINIASMYGMVGQDPRMYEGTGLESDSMGDYFFHKAGMINFTRYLATRYAKNNIRVNCISPGGLFADQPKKFLENYNRRVPLGRMADNDDIKGAVVYLASDASNYVTGHNLVVDGGWTAW